MTGFKYNRHHSKEFGLYFSSNDRTVLPPNRRESQIIPNRHGDLVNRTKTYDIRNIVLNVFTPNKNLNLLRNKIRDIADWLNEDGILTFDDEPDKSYTARVDDLISLQQLLSFGWFTITFVCQPFAFREVKSEDIKTGNNSIKYTGTAPAPCLITLTNNTSTPINNIIIQAIHIRR